MSRCFIMISRLGLTAVLVASAGVGIGACTGDVVDAGPTSRGQGPGQTPDQGGGNAGNGGNPGSSSGSPNGMAGGGNGAPGAMVNEGPVCRGTRDVPVTPLRRLTRLEYVNSVRDLLGLPAPARDDIPADENVGPFAANTVTAVTDLSTQQYIESAERLARAAIAKVDALIGCNRTAIGDVPCATQFIDRFAARSFRRPLTSEERGRYVTLFTSYASGGFAEGIRVVIQTILQSPNFLYHVEFGATPAAGDPIVALDSFQIAGRLSFFLWSSVPDDVLLNAAAGGKLSDAEAVRAQADRMLKDPRAADTITNFHLQWLDLAKLGGLTKDPALYPQFGPAVRTAMQAETLAFADHVLRQGDGRLETLLTAPFSVIDGPLFALYGVPRPAGASGPAVVQLDPKQRAGLLTQASFLASHAHENQSSPVARGVAVLRNVMCQALPDPPNNVNTVAPDPRPGATTRERFAEHQKSPACSGCHKLIDGIGMGFEAYDAQGAFRTTDQGRPVDARGEILGTSDLDGPFDGAVALAGKLAASREVRQCVARQWFRYALGRMESAADGCSLQSVFTAFASSGHDVRQLLAAIVTSDAFRFKRAGTN